MDGPHKGSRLQSTMWTDPMTRVENLSKVHKVDGPHKGSRLQSTMWTDPMTKVKNLSKSTKWTDLTKVKTTVHNVDGPNDKGRKFNQNPQSGQT